MRMRWTLAIAAWLAAATLATAASVGAVSSLRGLFGPSDAPLREADVEAQLTPVPTPSTPPPSFSQPSTPLPSSPLPSSPAETTRALVTAGGSLVATCADGLARLDSWIPRSGYETDHEVQGPAAVVSLRFKARSGGGSVRAQVTCRDGEPTLTVVDHD